MKGKKKGAKGTKKKKAAQEIIMDQEVLCGLFWATFWLRNKSPQRSKEMLDNISGRIDAAGEEERRIYTNIGKHVERALKKIYRSPLAIRSGQRVELKETMEENVDQ
ncbi:hypothetical protein Pmar_PMAR028247 [Perkinsus marinus ATCC 50983]|uniref:Uncharacterized protein n=1 Tax=Perkinsus marinus (strain ATCC 50983 / TXsc) TaxID=423536 RepID=C5LBD0_PERM5|nr:hypothetical protein Pmar_PMAR028247 [Perkinsus marinus ATCC 50983]EER06058.1 hypothetical protein Pmar_PMAR028247 [Perkinsus marinus ATCC 50983]|eukprot:XP_002774242.1 hypothetical protein Pmar_PMAR028247 [Perkinsus marinus ATCC 50983]